MAPHWVTIALAILSTYRITRFITRDQLPLIARPRRWIDKHWNPLPDQNAWESYIESPPEAQQIFRDAIRKNLGIKSRPTGWRRSIAYLIGCAWCTSIWVAAGVSAFIMIFIGLTWPWFILLWLTSSAVTGMIAQREPE